jgi:predicted RNA-binding Zn-ribbon protein involved in translation (DUF1610 family)
MKVNCLACGHKVELDEAYEDFEGPVKCLCGAMLEIRTEEGRLKAIRMAKPVAATAPKARRLTGASA